MDKMEKIIDREVAWRIFAFEFNRSNLYMTEGDERAPNYIVTPTGVKCNRLFIVGVVTEIENISHDNNLWRARIADPTGVFTVYAGQYQPEAAIFLSELQVPAYVAVVGKARKFEPEDGSVYVSVRPEEINAADEKLRDRWVLDTAERTFERINLIEEALRSGTSGNELKEFLRKRIKNPVMVEGTVLAIQHYKNLPKIILDLKSALSHAIESVMAERTGIQSEKRQELNKDVTQEIPKDAPCPEEPAQKEGIEEYLERLDEDLKEEITDAVTRKEKPEESTVKEPARPEPKEVIAEIIDKLDTGKGTTFSSLIEKAISAGLDDALVESCIRELMDEGRCYEPRIGLLRKV